MDRTCRRSQGVQGFRFGELRTGSLLLTDDVVVVTSSVHDLQLSLDRFAAECEAARVRISTSESGVHGSQPDPAPGGGVQVPRGLCSRVGEE